jgi:hypothetical protein
MVAQFVTLFAGLVMILENYIRQTLIAAGEEDTTVEKVSIITYLVYLFNGAVVVWPAFDGIMQADPSEILEEFKNMCASFVSSNTDIKSADPQNLIHASFATSHTDIKSADPPILSFSDHEEEFPVGPGPNHTTTLECPDTQQQIQVFPDEGNQYLVHLSEDQVYGQPFEHAGGVRAQPKAGQHAQA